LYSFYCSIVGKVLWIGWFGHSHWTPACRPFGLGKFLANNITFWMNFVIYKCFCDFFGFIDLNLWYIKKSRNLVCIWNKILGKIMVLLTNKIYQVFLYWEINCFLSHMSYMNKQFTVNVSLTVNILNYTININILLKFYSILCNVTHLYSTLLSYL
jgi:hypothetical protein